MGKDSHEVTLLKLAYAQRVANSTREELEAVRTNFQSQRQQYEAEKKNLEAIADKWRDRALRAERDLVRANAVIDYITKQ